jgi:hypothetical protein
LQSKIAAYFQLTCSTAANVLQDFRMGKYIEKAQLQHVSIMLIRAANALRQYCFAAYVDMQYSSSALLLGREQHNCSTFQLCKLGLPMHCGCTAFQHMLIRSTGLLYWLVVGSSTIAVRFNYVN